MIWAYTADPNMQSLIQYVSAGQFEKKKKKSLGSSLGKFYSSIENINGSKTNGSFTTAISNSFLSP